MTALIPVLRVAHLFITLAMIGVVLIQRSEGGGLGIGSTQGMGAFMTGRDILAPAPKPAAAVVPAKPAAPQVPTK